MITLLFLSVVLSTFAAAATIPAQPGVAIPLGVQGGLIRADGTFDCEGAVIHKAQISSKYRTRLLNGTEHSIDSGGVPKSLVKRAPGPVPLQPQPPQVWTAALVIGEPDEPQDFKMLIDTGSTDMWVPDAACGKPCAGKNTYNTFKSADSHRQAGTFLHTYGDGLQVTDSEVYTDNIVIGPFAITNQVFASVTDIESNEAGTNYLKNPYDGILGLAFPAASTMPGALTQLIHTLVAQGRIPNPQFSLRLSTGAGSELFLGGTNPQKFTGAFETHPVVFAPGETSATRWQINNGVAHAGPAVTIPGLTTIFDSGANFIEASPADVAAFYAGIPGSQQDPSDPEFYHYPCNLMPAVAFSWGGRIWTVSPQAFNKGPVTMGSPMCIGAVSSTTALANMGPHVWLLGTPFLQGVYSEFIMANPSMVGLATAV